jgi:hypothetical protein
MLLLRERFIFLDRIIFLDDMRLDRIMPLFEPVVAIMPDRPEDCCMPPSDVPLEALPLGVPEGAA